MITKILYYFLIIPISLLPFSIIYIISDLIYVIIYYLITYRKNIVINNLQNAFPKKSKEEIKKITKSFYRHFSDLGLEIIKGFTISAKQLSERLIIENPQVLDKYAAKNQSVILIGGHYNNWELCAQAFALSLKYKCYGIYKPLKNIFLNNKIYNSRTRFGLNLVSMKKTKSIFNNLDPVKAFLFASDQTPAKNKKSYWLNFLNQETIVFTGAEKYAREYNLPVFYVSVSKIKRGFYKVKFTLITEKPNDFEFGKITDLYMNNLEKDIIISPQYWLWTHKRWKHKR